MMITYHKVTRSPFGNAPISGYQLWSDIIIVIMLLHDEMFVCYQKYTVMYEEIGAD